MSLSVYMKKIFLIENHHEAYGIWKKNKLHKTILLHFDAHHDCDINYLAFDKKKYLQTGNFISKALHQNIVDIIYWIVPGYFKDYKNYYYRLVQLLYQLKVKDYTCHDAVIEGTNYLQTKVLDKQFIITTIDSLPIINKKVLLDVDLDYFIIKSLYKDKTYDDIGLRHPWISLLKFCAYLNEKNIEFDYATISYSTDGGWTPMKYKDLGNILAKKLGLKQQKNELCILAGNIFRQFRLEFENNNISKARKHYCSALTLNPNYFSFDNNYGKLYLMKGNVSEAEREFNKMLSIDKNYYYAYIGLGLSDLIQKKYQQALEQFDQVLKINQKNIIALSLKMWTYYYKGNYIKCKEIIENNYQLQRIEVIKYLIHNINNYKTSKIVWPIANFHFFEHLFYATKS